MKVGNFLHELLESADDNAAGHMDWHLPVFSGINAPFGLGVLKLVRYEGFANFSQK
jgi:hypothetical protein